MYTVVILELKKRGSTAGPRKKRGLHTRPSCMLVVMTINLLGLNLSSPA